MDLLVVSLILLAALAALLISGVWIAISLLGVGFIAMAAFTNSPAGPLMATTIWGSSASWSLTALPLFIWMGEILFRTRVSDDMFRGLAPWVEPLPGRLMHTNVVGCGIFAAISGSSAATAATIGRITIPELKRRGYDEAMAIGSLAGAGTLGLMIPPSIIMIVYGVAADVSIARLFVAGVLPGIMLMVLFSGYIALWALLHPGRTPKRDRMTTLVEKIYAARFLIPTVLLIGAVIGSIYAGIATPTEAASLGVIAALILAAFEGRVSFPMLRAVAEGTMRTTAMIMLIIMAAQFLNFVLASIGLTDGLGKMIEELGLGKIGTMILIVIFYLILGCFMETISMMILTTPFIAPIVFKLGWDPVWWGIVLTVLIEAALITPPVGLNLYVVQGMRGRGSINEVIRGSIPFVGAMIVLIALLMAAPDIALWLPRIVMG